MKQFLYINNTGADITEIHAAIVAAIADGGSFTADYADIFKLRKTPEGSGAEYAIEWA